MQHNGELWWRVALLLDYSCVVVSLLKPVVVFSLAAPQKEPGESTKPPSSCSWIHIFYSASPCEYWNHFNALFFPPKVVLISSSFSHVICPPHSGCCAQFEVFVEIEAFSDWGRNTAVVRFRGGLAADSAASKSAAEAKGRGHSVDSLTCT